MTDSLKAFFATLNDDAVASFIDVYLSLFGSTIMLDRLYSSCAVYAPPDLVFDIQQICAESGYVHSCGRHIYTESLQNADADDFTSALGRYLDRSAPDSAKVFLAAYASEDDPHEVATRWRGLPGRRKEAPVLRTYCGAKNIAQLLTTLQASLENVYVAAPGDYRAERKAFAKEPNADVSRTIWILQDHGSVNPPGGAMSPRYLVCYAQEWANVNPVYLLDEEKPAWVAQNTLPHTLAAALTNITRSTRIEPSRRAAAY